MNTPPSRCLELAAKMKELGIKPEWEVFSPTIFCKTWRGLSKAVWTNRRISSTCYWAPTAAARTRCPTPRASCKAWSTCFPRTAFSASAALARRNCTPVSIRCCLAGHARTGLEDNLYYAHGELATNVRLMERLVRIIRDLGMEPATPAEARAIMGLPRSSTCA